MSQQRITKIILACVCLIGFTLPGFAQQAEKTSGILGRLDPQTGAFTPLRVAPAVDSDLPEVTPTVTTGTLVVKFTITLKSVVPATSLITCMVNASVLDDLTASPVDIYETATVVATRSPAAATTASCTVSIPYSWSLLTPTTDTVSISYNVNAVTTSSSTTSTTLAPGTLVLRTHSSGLPTIKVPATGVTTSETVAITL